VALARAMVYRPALLLMDEPLGALDRKLREQMQLEIIRVHRERRMSVLYVTHDQEEALTMSDRIAVFNAGRVEQVGSPVELYERPATRFVASFVGEMNFLAGRLVHSVDGVGTVEVQGAVVQAGNPANLPDGSRVDLAVRPERVQAGPTGAATLPARIENVIYLGNARRLIMRLADGSECTMLQQASGAGPIATEGTISVSFDAEHATVFAA
jgi:putative spermidine/putrescine transport system ATP-binding protein